MVSDEALKKLQEQIAAWPMTQRFVVQQLIRDYLRAREDVRAYEATGLAPEEGGGVMERLTFEGNFCDIAQCRELPCPHNGACSQRKVWERLKAYEATRLTPEEVERSKLEIEAGCVKAIARTYGIDINRLRKLAEADKDGRLVVLPCKVGDTIYHISKVRTSHFEDDKIIIDDEGRWKIYEMPFALIHLPYIGKSYFLTREEAEKALKTKEG